MSQELSPEDLKELESQLSHPNGEGGIEVGNIMLESNMGMIKNTIDLLSIASNDSLLELGHGNGGHLEYLMKVAENISYQGLEVSDTMHAEAKNRNSKYGNLQFDLYNGETLPFIDNSFDKIFTVNTLYFWQKPKKLIQEIARVLKPEGKCNITFAQEDFMKNLPFVGEKFQLYNSSKLEELIKETALKANFKTIKEKVKAKNNEWVDREYTIATLSF